MSRRNGLGQRRVVRAEEHLVEEIAPSRPLPRERIYFLAEVQPHGDS